MNNLLKLVIYRVSALVTLFVPSIISIELFPSLTMGFIYLPIITLILAAGLMALDSQLQRYLSASKAQLNVVAAMKHNVRAKFPVQPTKKRASHFYCRWLGVNCSH